MSHLKLITDDEGDGMGDEGIPIGTAVWIGPGAGSLVEGVWGRIVESAEHHYGYRYGFVYLVEARGKDGILRRAWLGPSVLFSEEHKYEKLPEELIGE